MYWKNQRDENEDILVKVVQREVEWAVAGVASPHQWKKPQTDRMVGLGEKRVHNFV